MKLHKIILNQTLSGHRSAQSQYGCYAVICGMPDGAEHFHHSKNNRPTLIPAGGKLGVMSPTNGYNLKSH